MYLLDREHGLTKIFKPGTVSIPYARDPRAAWPEQVVCRVRSQDQALAELRQRLPAKPPAGRLLRLGGQSNPTLPVLPIFRHAIAELRGFTGILSYGSSMTHFAPDDSKVPLDWRPLVPDIARALLDSDPSCRFVSLGTLPLKREPRPHTDHPHVLQIDSKVVVHPDTDLAILWEFTEEEAAKLEGERRFYGADADRYPSLLHGIARENNWAVGAVFWGGGRFTNEEIRRIAWRNAADDAKEYPPFRLYLVQGADGATDQLITELQSGHPLTHPDTFEPLPDAAYDHLIVVRMDTKGALRRALSVDGLIDC